MSKVNALRKVAYYSDFKTRKMIAQGIIMSNLCYLVQLYGSSSDYLLSMLQVVQNTAARTVTRLPWNTPSSTLLLQCGWLSVRQMVDYYSLVLLYKIKENKKPTFLHNRISAKFGYNTRLAAGGGIPENLLFRTEHAKNSFINRTVKVWNKLPVNLRSCTTEIQFKKSLKSLVKSWPPD